MLLNLQPMIFNKAQHNSMGERIVFSKVDVGTIEYTPAENEVRLLPQTIFV